MFVNKRNYIEYAKYKHVANVAVGSFCGTMQVTYRRQFTKREFIVLELSPRSRVGNFIIGASGSDKQMLRGSSVARAAPTSCECFHYS